MLARDKKSKIFLNLFMNLRNNKNNKLLIILFGTRFDEFDK